MTKRQWAKPRGGMDNAVFNDAPVDELVYILGGLDRRLAYAALAGQTELSQELGFGRTRVGRLGSCSGCARRPPILKRFASESAECIARNEMALDVEGILDDGVNGQEPLC